MEPVDNIKARVEALQALGLSHGANASDIRDAWRDIAFHSHPDHTGGDYSGFSKAKTAYDFLRKEGLTANKPDKSSLPRRPQLKKRLIDLDANEIEHCRSMLRPNQVLPHAGNKQRAAEDSDAQGLASSHVPEAIGCFGRELTYFVATPVCEGSNRVVLPTSVLASCRKGEPEILTFQSKSTGAGEVVVPDAIRERKFPGAKSVKIRFEADQSSRETFCLAS
ncbi:J domain-containing protein [Ruegeria arenilitoris]|uniref:J domain-containing protein n=1 Tax=Ruegeria arenilitoris TaxID=1173585 RepID=UPI00147DA300|nr:J domain-containing protein [Ruegeria arenilitoris]